MFSLNHSTFGNVLPKINKGQSITLNHLERNGGGSVTEEALPGELQLSDWVRRRRLLCRCLPLPLDLGVAFASRMAGQKRMRSTGCR
jgi:hypothetical protein